mmetsp:Transcript_12005/g.33761  ORF Transcript_12005/g.33761 Transcript_12005/m.33761 type:complete len:176 (-) Transcript_12005:264-791(-)|eukprot:CAMPEP_0117671796 /NCGR_PEP_ID=MMETSP0804-20121206/13543_1 /TAXON_ID=1074897 /ORGANISM="Tetraselmis astigmatica, Strain CCMP880" /LENGTH=175 /DNA_ID=CAMNT_0005480317 /DNA_START=264 /DNA_END=791 /DNA_ORIENTATION=-
MDTVLGFEAFPGRNLTVMLFTDVSNGGEIKKGIVAGSHPTEAAFVNAELVPELFIFHLAAMKALLGESRDKLVTHSLHSELVYNVSGSKHISETLRRWGVSEGTKSLLVAKFDAGEGDVEAVQALVTGRQVPLEELCQLASNGKALQKAYKLTQQELSIGSAADGIAMRIAARDC